MSQQRVEGTVESGPKGPVLVTKNTNSYGDVFWYVGQAEAHTEDGEVLRTRDEAVGYAKRRGWLT